MREEVREILEIMLLMLAMIAFVWIVITVMEAIAYWARECWMNITRCRRCFRRYAYEHDGVDIQFWDIDLMRKSPDPWLEMMLKSLIEEVNREIRYLRREVMRCERRG